METIADLILQERKQKWLRLIWTTEECLGSQYNSFFDNGKFLFSFLRVIGEL